MEPRAAGCFDLTAERGIEFRARCRPEQSDVILSEALAKRRIFVIRIESLYQEDEDPSPHGSG
jgi:hypothetical protein